MSSPVVPDRPRLPWDPPEHFEKRVPEGDNRERLVCGRCEFIHYQNPKIVAGAVCTWNDSSHSRDSVRWRAWTRSCPQT